ncbi:hypothetical protein ONE63_001015 [Megalurothrips usitatus]|uniref:Uncharacterized protein n=1 Tax=Megalurothrips usitatus TaxID=439358 RepID=A0AAV7XHM0_9NEOP|nr:hypothetical protein ONE63_001015 [Megalurothrips usitatus]
MLSFTVVAGLLLVVLTKVGSVPVKESGTLLQLNTILERNSKLHVKISIDSGAGSQGAAYIGLCGSGSCCAFHLTGFSKENVVAESYAVSDTDNIGYQDGGRGNLAEAQWGQVDQRYGPDGWRDSEVNVVVQRLDDVFGLSMAGQEDSDENVFWVGCPSDANVLQVDSRSMGSRNISRLAFLKFVDRYWRVSALGPLATAWRAGDRNRNRRLSQIWNIYERSFHGAVRYKFVCHRRGRRGEVLHWLDGKQQPASYRDRGQKQLLREGIQNIYGRCTSVSNSRSLGSNKRAKETSRHSYSDGTI